MEDLTEKLDQGKLGESMDAIEKEALLREITEETSNTKFRRKLEEEGSSV